MSVSPIRLQGWRGPGCGPGCLPRSHDPDAHERYGYEIGLRGHERGLVRTGNLAVDFERCLVLVDGEETHVSSREWDVLVYLASRIGVACRIADVGAAIWGDQEISKLRCLSAAQTVARLRRRLGTAAHLLETVPPQNAGRRRLRKVDPA